MDEVQASVRPFLKELGFRARARAFNRTTSDGITQVIEFQLARFDPPGTHYVGFRQNLYGKFTVNVGVYVPELDTFAPPAAGKQPFVHEYDCWISERLGILGPEHMDIWWDLEPPHEQAAEVFHRIERDALPFLAQFEARDAILNQWMMENTNISPFDRSRYLVRRCGSVQITHPHRSSVVSSRNLDWGSLSFRKAGRTNASAPTRALLLL